MTTPERMRNVGDRTPKLVLSTAPYYRLPLEQAFRQASAAGFEAVEVMVTQDPDTQDAQTLRDLSKEHELSIEAIHAPFLLFTRRVWTTDPIEKIRRGVALAEEAEVPLLVVHPPYRWQTRYRRWIGRSLPELSARSGVIIGVENMFPVWVRGGGGVRFHASQDLESLDHYPTLVLDTSHLAVSGFDLLETYSRYREKIVHFHLSNNAGKGWDSHLSVDEGVLPLADLLRRVGSDGFGGTISIELDLRRTITDEGATREVLVRNREFCERHLGVRA